MRALDFKWFALFLLLPTVLDPSAAAAFDFPGFAGLEPRGEQVVVDAESVSYDDKASVITAHGAVKVTYGGLVLTADRVTIQRTQAVVEASGNVELTSEEGVLRAEFAHIDLRTETGWLTSGEFTFGPENLRIRGSRIDKLEGQRYDIRAGELTTCLCASGAPSWNLRGERVIVDLYGHGTFSGGRFDILGRPFLYLPVGLLPVRRERQSGLLTPRFGVSSLRGVQVEQPIYWAIDKSMDATVGVDIESGSRVGLVSEYRYARSQRSRGELGASYFNEKMRGLSSGEVVNREIADPSIPENRWSVRASHDQHFGDGSRGYLDLVRVGDDLMLREINAFSFDPDVDVAMRTKRFERSRVGVVKPLGRGFLQVSGRFYQDFINADGLTLDTAPEVEAFGERGFLGGRVVGRLGALGTNFERGMGYQGRRLILEPSLEIPWYWRHLVHGFVEGGMRSGFYDLDDGEVEGNALGRLRGPLADRPNRQFFFTAAEVGSELSRVWGPRGESGRRLKHTVEPVLRYLYVPEEGQSGLPLFDELDRMRSRNVFTYGLLSRLLSRRPSREGKGPIRELGRLAVSQSYDLANQGPDGQHASDLSLRLLVAPSDYFAFFGLSDLNIRDWEQRGSGLGFSVADPRPVGGGPLGEVLRGRSRLEASYRFVTGKEETGTLAADLGSGAGRTRIEEANARFVLRATSRFFLAAETRYDAVSRRFLENRYALRLISGCDCWVVDLGLSDRVNPDEVVVQATVTLVGLGSLGRESASAWQNATLLGGWPSLF